MQAWWWAIIVCTAVASAVVPAAIMAAAPKSAANLSALGTGRGTPSAPPGVVFAVVWSALFLLAGGALAYQGLSASSGQDWGAFALLLLAILLCWAWTFVFQASLNAGSWLILGILLLGVLGVVLWATGGSRPGGLCALWVPFLVWLVFALGLSLQTQTLATARSG